MKKLLCLAALAASCAFAEERVCNQSAPISITASGVTQIAASMGGKSIHVCRVSFASSAAVNVTFVAINAAGNTNLTGAYQNVSTMALDFNGDLATGAANSLGLSVSSTATIGGSVTYYQDVN
jgi:uncharacterized lipoprotein YbaY